MVHTNLYPLLAAKIRLLDTGDSKESKLLKKGKSKVTAILAS